MKVSEDKTINRAKLISAVRDYTKTKTNSKEKRVDFTVSPSDNDKKILIRAITETKSKSGYVSVDTVREMVDFLKKNNYDKGILIGNKFTAAAKREMKNANIELVSDNYSPNFKLERLFTTIGNYVEKLCKTKCGKIPQKDSDCKGYSDGNYSCDVRLISDNADFHHEKAWEEFLERDLIKLLTIEKKLNQ
jgi:hypothetical protein